MGRLLLRLCVFILPAVLCCSIKPTSEAVRGATLEPDRGEQFAVIIGINYRPSQTSESTGKNYSAPATLKNAENDAQDLYDLLLNNYGYKRENIRLFRGDSQASAVEATPKDSEVSRPASKLATDQAIREVLVNLGQGKWEKDRELNQDDSVLFYFSGHGVELKGGAGRKRLALLPADVRLHKDGTPDGKMIEIDDVCKHLKDAPVLRKLLILDCCHSGAVFETEATLTEVTLPDARPNFVFTNRPGEATWNIPAFQAIAASLSRERASDGSGRNSPFTDALLRTLRTLPNHNGKDQPFSVSRLFTRMEMFFDRARSQYPMCSRLTSSVGEFLFFPEGEFASDIDADKRLQRMLIAMVPGINGNWWFNETPWMMPALRDRIITNVAQERDLGITLLNIDELQQAAASFLASQPDTSDLSSLENMRCRHLRKILESRSFDRRTVLRDVKDELLTRAKSTAVESNQSQDDPLEAVDFHFLAVLLQWLGEGDDRQRSIDEYYKQAIKLYSADNVRHHYKPLLTLCYSDYGNFLSNDPATRNGALESFHKALEQFHDEAPASVQIYLHCRVGQTYLALRRWSAANKHLQVAHALAEKIEDSHTSHPLVGWAFGQQAWAYMDQWRVHEAEKLFERANFVLEPLTRSDPPDFDAVILRLHYEHGLAVTKRYNGDSNNAAEIYYELVDRIGEERNNHEEKSGGSSLSFSGTQDRFTERLLNSLMRRGDCGLFGNPRDLEQAENSYRRALRECAYVQSPDGERSHRIALLYKRALTLALPSNIKDAKLSRSLLNKADELSAVVATNSTTLAKLSERLAKGERISQPLHGLLADFLLRLENDSQESRQNTLTELRKLLKVQSREGLGTRSIGRDDLEALLFGTKLLVELDQEDVHHADRASVLDDIELLSNLCSLVHHGDDNAGILAFLRPYYDAAIEAHLALDGKHIRGVVELVSEATSPKGTVKDHREPRLLFYNTCRSSVLLLDVPGEISRSYKVGDNVSLDKVRLASEKPERRLSFPISFLQDWKKLSEASREKLLSGLKNPDGVVVAWCDPVHKLGVPFLSPDETGSKLSSTKASPHVVAKFYFPPLPFDLDDLSLKAANPNSAVVKPSEAASIPALSKSPD